MAGMSGFGVEADFILRVREVRFWPKAAIQVPLGRSCPLHQIPTRHAVSRKPYFPRQRYASSEVRALAQRSAEAAKEIKTLISTSSTQVGSGVKLVGQTGADGVAQDGGSTR